MSKLKIGDVFEINSGGSVTVMSYERLKEVKVRHNDLNAHVSVVSYSNLKKGSVKNPYQLSVFGKGFYGVGSYSSSINNNHTYTHAPSYVAWKDMLHRCYNPKSHEKNPCYIDCEVSEKWLNFQNFAEWYVNHTYYDKGYELDKDILVRGNNIYSEENCTLVPKCINSLLSERAGARGLYLIGVSYDSSRKKFRASMAQRNKNYFIGRYETEIEAHQAYVLAKEKYVKQVANEWRYRIEKRAYDALMCWQVQR